jgi:riboflavin kinase/FMN adenylyltransferase
MELIRGLHNLRPRHRGCVATIGAFDGVHRGHQAVLRQLQAKGRELGLPTAVVLFEPLPREFFAPEKAPPRLMNFREKVQALRALGIDRVLRVQFSRAMSDMGAEHFARTVFVEGLGVQFVVMGDDQHFGRNREGDFALLRRLGESCGFHVEAATTVQFGGERISSTRIRTALQRADFHLAEQLLGHPFRMTGRVMHGQQLGRRIGVPTANLQLYRRRAPLSGVFTVEVEGAALQRWPGVANIGTRPTIGDLTRAILEVHLLDFEGNLYGRTISVTFRSKLRDEHRFESIAVLAEQIQRDLADGRRFFDAEAVARPI